jgi:hypothetical protein
MKENVKELSVDLEGSELGDSSTEGRRITESQLYFETLEGVMEDV